MKTKISVMVTLEITHQSEMKTDEMKKLALRDIHHSEICGASIKSGKSRVEEIRRVAVVQ